MRSHSPPLAAPSFLFPPIPGATQEEIAYRLYFWNLEGQLVKRIDGPKLGLCDLAWHPHRTFAAACTNQGPLQIWGTDINWAAFAPEFEEIEENEE